MRVALLLLLFTSGLFAQPAPAPIPFGVSLTRGTTTLYCQRIDLRPAGGVFALLKPSIALLLHTSNPATSEFEVTIVTQDGLGNTHQYSDHTAVGVRDSPLWFPTDDAVLLLVTVKEKTVLAQNNFAGEDR